MKKAILALAAGILALSAAPAMADPLGDPAEGHRLALRICSACHVAAADQEAVPLLKKPAPSFQQIANRPSTSAASLRNFLMTIHRTLANGTDMPNPELTDDQTRDVVSYMMSLRSEKPGARN